jgi:hypothetical protein
MCCSFLFCNARGRSGSFAENSERQIDDLDPLLAVDDAITPYRVEIGEGLFRDGFLGRIFLRTSISQRDRAK